MKGYYNWWTNCSDKCFFSFTNVAFILHTLISTVTYLELKQTHLGCVLNGLESRCDLLNINRYPRFTTALNQIWRIITHLIKFCFILSQTQDQTLKKKIYGTLQPYLPRTWHIYIILISYTNKQHLPQVYIEAFVFGTNISVFNTPSNTNIIAWKIDTW